MATTTNYGWTTPDDTDLVKDGAAAIRTLGSSVDTTTKNLNPETTLGDMSFRSSTSNVNTRIPIGSSGQHLTVVAGVPTWATASDQTPLTTKGDLFTFSTLDARLGVGANNTVLTADSAEATGLKWATPAAGGMTLLETITLSGANVTSSSISGSYVDLVLYVENFKPASDGQNCQMRINSDSNLRYSSTNMNTNQANKTFDETEFNIALGQDSTTAVGLSVVNLYRYASTGIWKCGDSRMFSNNDTTVTNYDFTLYKYAYNQTGAITSLFFKCSSGNFTSGTVYIYGVK